MRGPGEWTPAKIERLKSLWGTMSARAVADALGLNKNQVLGKAHRMGLPNLGSPIKRGAEPRAERPKSIRHQLYAETAKANRAKQEPKPAAAVAVAPPPPVPVVTRPAVPPRFSSREACAWPIGDPRAPGFHFCGAVPVVEGKPYCHEHCRIAYQTPEQAARARAAAAREAA